MEYKHRSIEFTNNIFTGFPVVALTGPRQVGKTTLLEYIGSTMPHLPKFVSLDDTNLRIRANEDPEGFLDVFGTPLVIDEFQYAPNLLSHIKMRVDKARKDALFKNHKPVETMYYLTGSQAFQTMKNISDSLAGRIEPYTYYALNARELDGRSEVVPQKPFLPDHQAVISRSPSAHLNTAELFNRIITGFYPELYVNPSITADRFYSAYMKTYLERDVRSIAAIKDEVKFLKFLSCLATRTAQEYNASSIASDIQVDEKTVDAWLSIAKNTHLVYLLQPYSANPNSRAVKHPKIHFTDTGLACYLAGYTNSTFLENSAYSGPIFETYVINEVLKSFVNNGIDPRNRLYYYRDYDQKEIDLIIKDGKTFYPVEIKKTSSIPKKDATDNFKLMDKLIRSDEKVAPGTIICNYGEIVPMGNGCIALPIEYI